MWLLPDLSNIQADSCNCRAIKALNVCWVLCCVSKVSTKEHLFLLLLTLWQTHVVLYTHRRKYKHAHTKALTLSELMYEVTTFHVFLCSVNLVYFVFDFLVFEFHFQVLQSTPWNVLFLETFSCHSKFQKTPNRAHRKH